LRRGSLSLVVGHDSRFIGREILRTSPPKSPSAKDIDFIVRHADADTDDSHAIRFEKAVGGINFTASHNPPEYQGIKFSTLTAHRRCRNNEKDDEEYISRLPCRR
jgi:phosphoglucomutase